MQNVEQIIAEIKPASDATFFDQPVTLTPSERAQLILSGFEPILVIGKPPVTEGWQAGAITAERVAAECALYPHALSTGLRTGTLVGIDLDVVDEPHVARLTEVAEQILGSTPLRRFGSKGLMLCYRNETPIRKITVAAKGAKVELLGIGQQFVAFGIHPDTHAPYRWLGETDFDEAATPLIVPLDVLPAVTPDQLRDFARKANAILAELGYEPGPPTGDMGEHDPSPSASTGSPVAVSVLRSALAYRDAGGPRDEWRNDIAAIRAANIPDDEHLNVRRQIAHDYSLGRLDRTGRFKDATPKNYSGPEAVDLVFDTMPPRQGGISVGWVFEEARKAGWQGNPFSDGKTATETFAEPVHDFQRQMQAFHSRQEIRRSLM